MEEACIISFTTIATVKLGVRRCYTRYKIEKEKKVKDDTYKKLGKELVEAKVEMICLKEAAQKESIAKIKLEAYLVDAKVEIVHSADQAFERVKEQRLCLHPNLDLGEFDVFKVIWDKYLVNKEGESDEQEFSLSESRKENIVMHDDAHDFDEREGPIHEGEESTSTHPTLSIITC